VRHKVFGKRLSRDTNARKALLKNLASSLIINGKITTTLAKARFARGYIEKLVTVAKSRKLSSHRKMASGLTNEALKKLVGEIGPGFAARPGGYIRIIKLEQRSGDAAQMARLEFLQWEKVPTKKPPQVKVVQPETEKNLRKSAVKSAKSTKAKK